MTDDDRKDWLIAARASLNGIPADLLARGCAVARKYCDHPSKVVPAIMREVSQAWESRKRARLGPVEHGERREAKPGYVTPAEAAAILKEFGLK